MHPITTIPGGARLAAAGVTAIAVVGFTLPASADDCGYDLVVLRSPGCESAGAYGLVPWGMNNHGAVAGRRQCWNYSNFHWPGIGDDLIYLQAPVEGATDFEWLDLNDDGLRAGRFTIPGVTLHFTVVYDGTTFVPIMPPEGGDRISPLAINNHGHVAGYWGDGSIAYWWDGRTVHDLGTFGGDHSTAHDISDRGTIVGTFGTGPWTNDRGFLFDEAGFREIRPIPNGLSAEAWAVNELDQVVVNGRISIGETWPWLWEEGRWTEIGAIPGDTKAHARDINDDGVVVGTSGQSFSHAFRWHDGVIVDLHELASPDPDRYLLSSAYSINDHGEIAVAATDFDAFVGGPLLIILRPRLPKASDLDHDCRTDESDLVLLLAQWGAEHGDGDLDEDGLVGFDDLLQLLDEWGPLCHGDLTGDARIDYADLVRVLDAWGDCPDCPEDFNRDGVVNESEVLMIRRDWGACE